MKILLAAPDSLMPNLALMKLSTYHKNMGDEVGFHVGDPDIIYCSLMFKRNQHLLDGYKWFYPDVKIRAGGPGYDHKIRLPENVEKCPPDHLLYPGNKYSIGRVTSGCIRNCHFCIVPKMETEGIRFIQHPKEIWKPGTILRLLDDNILAMPDAFWMVHGFCLNNDIKLHMEYLDIRLLNSKFASALRDLKHDTGLWFSFDFTKMGREVRDGIKLLYDVGFTGRNIHFFVYLHDEKAIPDAKYRWGILRDLGVETFLMVNEDNMTRRLKKIRRRGCRPAAWRGLAPAEVFA